MMMTMSLYSRNGPTLTPTAGIAPGAGRKSVTQGLPRTSSQNKHADHDADGGDVSLASHLTHKYESAVLHDHAKRMPTDEHNGMLTPSAVNLLHRATRP